LFDERHGRHDIPHFVEPDSRESQAKRRYPLVHAPEIGGIRHFEYLCGERGVLFYDTRQCCGASLFGIDKRLDPEHYFRQSRQLAYFVDPLEDVHGSQPLSISIRKTSGRKNKALIIRRDFDYTMRKEGSQ
jgi:hypothetical protein